MSDFHDWLLNNPPEGEFRPYLYYDHRTDCLYLNFLDIADFSEPVNEQMVLNKSLDDGRITGVKVCGIRQLVRRFRGHQPAKEDE